MTDSSASASEATKPITFRLPRAGQRDAHFGLARTTYYELENSGAIQLIRIKKRGRKRGIVLIPLEQMRLHLRSLAA